MFSRLGVLPRSAVQLARQSAALRSCVVGAQRSISLSQQAQNASDATPAKPNSKSVWDMYKEKAGLSAPIVFGAGLSVYLLSKEILIIHDETLLAAVIGGTFYWLSTKIGKPIAEGLDKYSQDVLDQLNEGKDNSMKALEQAIEHEKSVKDLVEFKQTVFDVLKENNTMRMELEYRNRLHEVENEVKKRLDYQLDLQQLERNLEQRHIANWIEDAVVKSITPQQEKETIAQCIKDIKGIVAART